MTHAFGAFFRVDLVDFPAQVNGLVRALGLAHIAVDALVGDDQSHDLASATGSKVFGLGTMNRIIGGGAPGLLRASFRRVKVRRFTVTGLDNHHRHARCMQHLMGH